MLANLLLVSATFPPSSPQRKYRFAPCKLPPWWHQSTALMLSSPYLAHLEPYHPPKTAHFSSLSSPHQVLNSNQFPWQNHNSHFNWTNSSPTNQLIFQKKLAHFLAYLSRFHYFCELILLLFLKLWTEGHRKSLKPFRKSLLKCLLPDTSSFLKIMLGLLDSITHLLRQHNPAKLIIHDSLLYRLSLAKIRTLFRTSKHFVVFLLYYIEQFLRWVSGGC